MTPLLSLAGLLLVLRMRARLNISLRLDMR
jgi:hypothetical protein